MRDRRVAAALVTTVVAAIALAGCGGGHSGDAGGLHPGKSAPTAPPKPLKVVSVSPHKVLKPMGDITVAFASALSPQSPLPALSPKVPGSWARQGSTAVFTPSQAYPPDASITVKVAKKPGAKRKVVAKRDTPHGSLIRVQQILAHLHYVPVTTSAATPTTPAEEADSVYAPPTGIFRWQYEDTPASLKRQWTPGEGGEVLRGAVIAFQHDHDLPVDGLIGKLTWQALIAADLADQGDPNKYSYVSANLDLPQTLSVWVAGSTVLTSPVNGGVAGAPTPLGTFPVYERLTSTTMSGTNPDGSHYSDPGVPWVNYFSGGSAVHGFPRSSYGSPQSVGCLELPIHTAEQVFDLITYGTLVDVAGPAEATSTVGRPSAPSSPSASTSSTPSPSSSASPTH